MVELLVERPDTKFNLHDKRHFVKKMGFTLDDFIQSDQVDS